MFMLKQGLVALVYGGGEGRFELGGIRTWTWTLPNHSGRSLLHGVIVLSVAENTTSAVPGRVRLGLGCDTLVGIYQANLGFTRQAGTHTERAGHWRGRQRAGQARALKRGRESTQTSSLISHNSEGMGKIKLALSSHQLSSGDAVFELGVAQVVLIPLSVPIGRERQMAAKTEGQGKSRQQACWAHHTSRLMCVSRGCEVTCHRT